MYETEALLRIANKLVSGSSLQLWAGNEKPQAQEGLGAQSQLLFRSSNVALVYED